MAEADLYDILGVSPDADLADIKQSYRRLVREFHPDVSADKLAAHDRFVAIVNAYKTLSDPIKRAMYDRARQREAQHKVVRDTVAEYSWREELRRQSVDALLTAAELYLFRGQPELAVAKCQEVLQRDPNNPHAYALMGDIYRELGKFDEAVTAYTYAVQFAPKSQLYQRRLEELLQMERAAARRTAAQAEDKRRLRSDGRGADAASPQPVAQRSNAPSPAGIAVGVTCIGLALASLVWVWFDPGVLLFNVVPKHALVAAALSAFLLGLALPLLHWVGHVDEELLMSADTFAGGAFPVGTLIGLLGLFWFYLSVICYVVLALVQEQFSWSVVKMMGVTLALMCVFAALCPAIATQVFLWGGNVIFTSLLVGWSIGSMGRSRW
ncbi:MAG: DnaJ domain-containing protein [Abditibacteriales bacterium]|nr:DnaJ domain-containing protein [Abditibacteriales bacterium]MDW8365950.1 DnaJ domain-containing protein [Abditibacteriales bacterium]